MDTPVDRCPHCFSAMDAAPCPQCGWRPGADNPPPALGLGTRLDGRYRIGRVLGHGGFGITYLAWDDNLHLRLAIKEYLPRDCASRAQDGVSLVVYSGPAQEQFAYGLDRFLEEARALARFDQHPGVVTVKSFFRAHGTGYCVMDFVEGFTLKQYLERQSGGRIPFEQALRLLMPAMDALRAVHQEGLLHRDLSPDNIYLSRSGRIKLLDFGAARFAAGEHSKSLSIILKPGFAPEEQYRARGKQGPWTDVYGLAATLYRAITGQVPPDALDRLDQDELVPPSRMGVDLTPEREAVLLKALAVKAQDRYPSIADWQQAWKAAETPAPAPSSPTPPLPPPRRAWLKVTAGLLVIVVLTVGGWYWLQWHAQITADDETQRQAESHSKGEARLGDLHWQPGVIEKAPEIQPERKFDKQVATRLTADIMLVMNLTDSMAPYIKMTINAFTALSNSLLADPEMSQAVRFGFVGYHDDDDGMRQPPGLAARNLTPDLLQTKQFISLLSKQANMPMSHNDDYSEDVYAGFKEALLFKQWRDGIRFIVLIGNTSAHEADHPKSTTKLDANQLRALADEANVYVFAIHIRDDKLNPKWLLTEQQFGMLAMNKGTDKPALFIVEGGTAEEFEGTLQLLIGQIAIVIKAARTAK